MSTFYGGSLQRTILDEIALEGLEGITLNSLWIYLGKILKISETFPDPLKENVWRFILSAKDHLQFYELPVERPPITLCDRYQSVDVDLGIPLSPQECPFVRYKCAPISDENILGSCEYYKERIEIPHCKVKNLKVSAVLELYRNKFVIVASQELRYNALTPENVTSPRDLTPIQYSIWEAIGRSRYNGETTSGVWSLSHFCKDPSIIFYIKNKLIRLGLVTSTLFHEKRKDRLIVTALLTLPRFYPSHRSVLMSLVEKLFLILKESPDFSMPIIEARVHFLSFEKQKSFKKAMLTHVFRKIFETQSFPYSDVFPSSKAKNSSSSRTVTIVKLRHPEKSIDNIFEDIENEQYDENTGSEFHSDAHSYVDMPLQEEFYRCVARYGNRGCSQSAICKHLAINHLCLRQVIKKALLTGLVKTYYADVGRQRTSMYVAAECFDSVNKSAKDSLDALQNLQCAPEPKIPKNDAELPDLPEITARVKNYIFPANATAHRKDTKSQRLILRKAFVVKMVDEHGILSVNLLRKSLVEHEKSKGIKDEVCFKSVKRLLYHMSQNKTICVYEIVLQREENIAIYRYVTHPKIHMEHVAFKNEVVKLKNSLYLAIEEKRHRLINALRNQKMLTKTAKKPKVGESKLNKNTILPVKCHKPPKFLISRYMHEFLFYIVVELNDCQAPLRITKELLQTWLHTEPSLRVDEYLEQLEPEYSNLKVYTKQISWRTFISPLPRYSDKPAGWVYFVDAMDRMPLSIFNKIFRIDKGADAKLTAYLNHPIRQHYLMRQLPSELQCKISRVQLQRVYISLLKLLNHMGLIQVTDRQNVKDPLLMWVYLNRRARVLDTTKSEAGYKSISSEREYTPIPFDLRSFEDIHCYWTTLQRICVYTKLGFRSRIKNKENELSKTELSFLKAVDFDEAPLHDTGDQPGDGLGAAGLSTNLFAHTFRNWSWSVHSNNKSIKNTRTGRSVGCRGTSKSMRVISRKSRQPHGLATVKRVSAQSVSNTKVLKKSGPRDAIDHDALKNMRTLRVKWSKIEDEVLLIAKAAYTYVAAPVSALGLLTVGKACRDVIRRSLGILNKTCQACVRRVHFISQQGKHIPQVPTWLHMLQTDEYLQKKYGDNFLQRLKQIYKTRPEYYEALSVHFTLIMCYLFKLVHNDYDNTTKSRFILPDSIREFQKRFIERTPVSTDEDTILYKNPKTLFDLQTIVVENVFHSSLCSMRDKTPYNLQAFEIYKSYSDEVLERAFSKARTDGLTVAVKRKNIGRLPAHLSGPAYILSSKYKLKLLFLRIPYGMYDAFYKFFTDCLTAFFKKVENESDDTSIELKSPTPSQLFVISEGLGRNIWTTSIKFPVNILTVDAEQNQANISSMDRIIDHYSIFDNVPQPEYTKVIESGQNEKQSRVKFHPANLCYKINYSPYDFIAKLPNRYLHFFCALDFLEQEIEINFSKLQRVDDDGHIIINCPFKCIFANEDYMAEIKRIVEDKKVILNTLTEMAPQKLLNLATSGLSMKVYNSNILTLVRMLESYWHEKESKFERQDLGKYASNLKCSKSIDWCKLCNDIVTFNDNSDDFDKTEEYEPTLNKEERAIRAQDVFVVNLPTIKIKINNELRNDKDTICLKKDLDVPKKILEPELSELVLKKVLDDSMWNYNNSCFGDIKEKMKSIGFSGMEQNHLEEIHNFIEQHELGVPIDSLMDKFPYENFLFKALNLLSSANIIKRVGVSSFMYVHKNHIRSWVVHTFNLKRLDRENIGGSTTALKRVLSHDKDTYSEEDNELPHKKAKTISTESDGEDGKKRTPKPVIRYDASTSGTESSSMLARERSVIAMKPVPWIRLNGSINRRVLDRYLGSILSESIGRNGCRVHDICKRFSLFVPVDIFFLLELLSDLKCISLIHIPPTNADLFSNFEISNERTVSCVYDADNTYIKVHGDAIMRLSLFIGEKMYSTELV